ncbi:MAG: hypothetical protein Q9175_004987 [Cornicularia normoerica]
MDPPSLSERPAGTESGARRGATAPGNVDRLSMSERLARIESEDHRSSIALANILDPSRLQTPDLVSRHLTSNRPSQRSAHAQPHVDPQSRSEMLPRIEREARSLPGLDNIREALRRQTPGLGSQHHNSDRLPQSSVDTEEIARRDAFLRHVTRQRTARGWTNENGLNGHRPSNARAETFIKSLPVVSHTDLSQDTQDCPICIEQYYSLQHSESPVRLPCSHIMGKECLLRWLKSSASNTTNNSCPICRAVLLGRDHRPLEDRPLDLQSDDLREMHNRYGLRTSNELARLRGVNEARRDEEHQRTLIRREEAHQRMLLWREEEHERALEQIRRRNAEQTERLAGLRDTSRIRDRLSTRMDLIRSAGEHER